MIIQKIIGSIFLVICSVTDICSRKIYLNICIAFIALGIFINGLLGNDEISNFMMSVLPGAIVIIIAILTRESIGIGDGVVISTIGVLYGLKSVLKVCGITFFILSVYCLLMLFAGKKRLKDKVPFSPFLIIGNMLFVLYGVIV